MSISSSIRIAVAATIIVISANNINAQEPAAQKPKASSSTERSAALYQQCLIYLGFSFPEFQKALDQQLKDGKENPAVSNWLKLFESVRDWPKEEKSTDAQKVAKREEELRKAQEMRDWLIQQGEEPKGDSKPAKK
jgi:hypothetical protein